MIMDKNRIRGFVTVCVREKDGTIKTYKRSFIRKVLGAKAKPMRVCHHNTITKSGDALIADLMSCDCKQNKVDSVNGHIIVGNGWTGISTKENTNVNSACSTYKKLTEGYPKLEADFGIDGDNIVLYRACFDSGELNCDNINEVALLNGCDENALCLAYAQITPAVNVSSSDSLQIDWTISICGS